MDDINIIMVRHCEVQSGECYLVAQAKLGDKNAFEQLIRPYHGLLYGVARGLLKHPEDIEDAIQDTLIQSWQKLLMLRDNTHFKSWLVSILVNKCKGRYRLKKTESLDVQPESLLTTNDRVEERQLRMMIDQLSVKLREPLLLHYFAGFSLEECARTLHIPVNTVKSRLKRARVLLRTALMDKEDEK